MSIPASDSAARRRSGGSASGSSVSLKVPPANSHRPGGLKVTEDLHRLLRRTVGFAHEILRFIGPDQVAAKSGAPSRSRVSTKSSP